MCYALTKRVALASAVDHCVKSAFTGPNETNLIVAKACFIQIYLLHPDEQLDGLEDFCDEVAKATRLKLVYETMLFGNVEAMASIRLFGHATDALILCFADCRVSIVEWDASKHKMDIVSMHRFDPNVFSKQGPSQHLIPPRVIVDYERRCACVLVCDCFVAVIPFIDTRGASNSIQSTKNLEAGSEPAASKVPARGGKKAYYPPSYVVRLPDYGVKNAKDIKFMHGYYEPALMILYEPVGSWIGRCSIFGDSASVAIITLNMPMQKSMLVWSVDHLPYNCYRICPLRSPGGACILSPNAILYLDHSSRYRLSLNKFGDDNVTHQSAGKFVSEASPLTLSLDNAQYTFLNDYTVLLSISSGHLVMMSIVSDGRTVTHIDLHCLGSSILVSCLCVLSEKYLFLGARLADSLLMVYRSVVDASERVSDKKRLATTPVEVVAEEGSPDAGSAYAQYSELIDEEDFEEGVVKVLKSMQLSKLTLQGQTQRYIKWEVEAVESLICIAPLGDYTFKPIVKDEALYEHSETKEYELIACSGIDKSGALTIIRHGIRPVVVSSVDLADCNAIWTLYCESGESHGLGDGGEGRGEGEASGRAAEFSRAERFQKYIFLAQSGSTVVLEVGDDNITIASGVPDIVRNTSLNAGNVAGGRLIVQVQYYCILLLDGLRVVQVREVPEGRYVVWSDISDPYVAVLLDSGVVQLYELDESLDSLDLARGPPELCEKVTMLALFRDKSNVVGFNLLTAEARSRVCELPDEVDDLEGQVEGSHILDEEEYVEMCNDPIEIVLYGGIGARQHAKKKEKMPSRTNWESKVFPSSELVRPTYLALTYESGTLEFYRISTFECVYRCAGLNNGRQRLEHDNDPSLYWTFSEVVGKQEDMPIVVDLRIESVGSKCSLPFLIACLDDGNILVYHCYFYEDLLVDESVLPIRFVRVSLPTVAFNTVYSFHQQGDAPADQHDDIKILSLQKREWVYSRIHPFFNLSGFSGFFITGDFPMWIFCERDYPRMQRLVGEGSIHAWAPINSAGCPNGFIYTTSGRFKFAYLDPSWNVECTGGGTSVFRIPLRMTPYSIAYDSEENTVAVVLSNRYVDMTRYLLSNPDLPKKDSAPAHLDLRLPPIFEEKYELHLIDPSIWETTDVYALLPEECGIVRLLSLDYYTHADRRPKRMNFLVLATAIVRGEDVLCKGRIVVFDIVNQLSSSSPTRAQLNLKFSKERRSPVSSIDCVNGILIASEGRQIYLYQLRANEGLYPIAFFDVQLSTVDISVIKNYILLGDIHRSIRLLRWMDPLKNLQLLAKDYDKFNVLGTTMILQQEKLSLVASDDRGNIYLYVYDPEDFKSLDGTKLICQGDFYYGTLSKCMVRFQARPLPGERKDADLDIGTFLGGLDGSLAYMIPISDHVFAVLRKIESRLVEQLEHTAGLHPYAFRLTRPAYRLTHTHVRAVLDGELLFKFVQLERTKQDEIAQASGSTTERVLDYLAQGMFQAGVLLAASEEKARKKCTYFFLAYCRKYGLWSIFKQVFFPYDAYYVIRGFIACGFFQDCEWFCQRYQTSSQFMVSHLQGRRSLQRRQLRADGGAAHKKKRERERERERVHTSGFFERLPSGMPLRAQFVSIWISPCSSMASHSGGVFWHLRGIWIMEIYKCVFFFSMVQSFFMAHVHFFSCWRDTRAIIYRFCRELGVCGSWLVVVV
ncbi:uncharacterized protein LOC126320362 [Schistocerca gregaria]|uniref:uncharacterized protein LOC126320362 n=1 Tax=Schistocerca gregaria TaxID=7010 RepID=UPI00211EF889|nr:uncharacterized protein LOC126320362 [Schistocerca gregaria]